MKEANNSIKAVTKKWTIDSKDINFKKNNKEEEIVKIETTSSYPRYRVYIDRSGDDLEERDNTMDFNFKDYPKRKEWCDVEVPILSINVKDAFNSKEEFLKNIAQ